MGEITISWNLENRVRYIPVKRQMRDGRVEVGVGSQKSGIGQSEPWIVKDGKG